MADSTSPTEPIADVDMVEEDEPVHEDGQEDDAMAAIEAEVPEQAKFLEYAQASRYAVGVELIFNP